MTILDENDQVIHEDRYCTLGEVAHVLGLPRASELARYRGLDTESARDDMLDQFGIWFLLQEQTEMPPTLNEIIREQKNDEGDDDNDDDDDDDEENDENDDDDDDDEDEDDEDDEENDEDGDDE